MFNRDGTFTIDGHTYPDFVTTSDGLVAVFNNAQDLWLYYRLDWRREVYTYVGSTGTFHDPDLEAFDKSQVYPVTRGN